MRQKYIGVRERIAEEFKGIGVIFFKGALDNLFFKEVVDYVGEFGVFFKIIV